MQNVGTPRQGDIALMARDAFFENASDGVIVLDAQKCIVNLNPAAGRIIGLLASEVIGRPVAEVLAAHAALVERCCGVTEESTRVTFDVDEAQRYCELRISPLQGQHKRITGYLMLFRDVTQRVRAEQALRQLDEELESRVSERTAKLSSVNAELIRELDGRTQVEATLLRRNRELLSLQSAAAATVSSLDVPFVLETVTWEIVSLLRVDGCAVYEWNQESDSISVLAEYGSTSWWEEASAVKTYDLAEHPRKKRVLAERYAQQLTSSQPDIDTAECAHMQAAGLKALLMLPMTFQGRVVGLVEIGDGQDERTFTDHEISLIQLLADQAASAIENARLYEHAQEEIAERKRAEAQIRASLKEKEVLLQEIHHRVKNNLQVVSSLLNLQSRGIQDEATLEMFQESQNRIQSMALIHEKLYRSQDLARIDLAEYVRNLATDLVRTYRAQSGPVNLKINAADVFLSIDKAVPCGLIVNELICNALKHAFSARRSNAEENEIRVDLSSDHEQQVTLVVGDNGVGFPKDLDFQTLDSLGLRLINTLIGQLEGAIELNSNDGAEFKITFSAA
jgi:PAS domain S-box-containing protein